MNWFEVMERGFVLIQLLYIQTQILYLLRLLYKFNTKISISPKKKGIYMYIIYIYKIRK